MRDQDLRQAVLRKVLAEYVKDPNSRVVEELGLQHGSNRVDIAVVNGVLHGYELKSEADNLDRLQGQIESYSKVFDRVTLVTTSNHLSHAVKQIPEWWGVKLASRGIRGGINISNVRKPRKNPSVSPFHIAQLLWRNEAIAILEMAGADKKMLRTNRAGLYQLLTELFDTASLREHVRQALKCRENWRDQSLLG